MKILLDTNFILACVKQKIDLTEAEHFNEKVEWVIPLEVINELKDLSERKGEKIKDKNSATLGLELIEFLSPEIIKVKNPNVDQGIADYISERKIVLATLDRKLKKKVQNKKVIIKGRKKLEII